MRQILYLGFLSVLSLFSFNCRSDKGSAPEETEERQLVEMQTSHGLIAFELYNETPKHRDNFIKLVESEAYDSILFHRVIHDFVIQAGDPDSKRASAQDTLGEGDLDYKVEAEFLPEIFHKRGAVGAARDGNPERASSAMQFYIVQRGPQSDSLIDIAETRINKWLAEHYFKKDPANSTITKALEEAQENKDADRVRKLSDSLEKLASAYTNFETYRIPEAHREVYRSLGGIPHLDQNYTVFGEVVQGMDIVDSIARAETDMQDRPVEPVRIISMKLLVNSDPIE